jgi:hypothetical protein
MRLSASEEATLHMEDAREALLEKLADALRPDVDTAEILKSMDTYIDSRIRLYLICNE